ncbi:MAG TPA: ABC transporter permease [Pyrinomonadaceae bacterium]|jgi:predicted permease|nr:ABC transporter permease [Pyrinomonadaceae bacterium]
MLQDIRYGVRMLFKKPGFTLIAVLSLALGIGANTAIFSLLDAVLLRTLPVHEPEKLVLFGNGKDQGVTISFPDQSTDLFSYPFYRRVEQRSDLFDGMAGLMSITWTVHGFVNASSEIERMQVQLVTGSYFPVLSVNASLGRVLTEADDQTQGGHPVAVVSYAWWQRRMGGDPSAIGKTITIDSLAYTIVGVAPKEFFGTTVGTAPDLWVPLAMEKQLPPMHFDGRNDDGFQELNLIARLREGVSADQASAATNLLFKQWLGGLDSKLPIDKKQQNIQNAKIELTPVSRGLSTLREQFSLSLKVLMGVVALVLLIASANVANLLLAHGAARSREFAVRMAVGAGRLRLVRQLFTESALLALLGGVVGVAFAWWGSRLLLVMASDGPEALPVDVTPNLRILGFTIGVSVLCAIVFGIAPALRASRTEPNTSLKGGKNPASTLLRSPLGKTFVVAQVALSLLLLIGAGLFVRTLINLQNIPSGFNQENALLLQVDTSATGYKTDDPKLPALLNEVEEKVKAVPGVQAASFAFTIFNQGFWTGAAHSRDDNIPEGQSRALRNNIVGPDFFTAMGIPLVQGRGFGPQDTASSQKVAVVSESMARRFFPGGSAVGNRFGLGRPGTPEDIEVIGVVKDAKYGTLKEEFQPMAFYPYSQRPEVLGNFVVRFSGPESAIVPQIREVIRQTNNNLPIDDVVSLSEHIGRSLVQQKLVARLASFFGLLALLLACVGLYGVMSYGVARRTNEIGIRMALGARGGSVLWLVLREALVLVAIGLAVGLVAAFALTRTAESLLYELKPNDPLTIASATLLLAGIALFAGYFPARRAARVDPMVALRDE